MEACFSRVRDKIRSNGGLSNVNSHDAEDPQNLVDEFHSLYNEKLKEIEKAFPETLEPKCQALTELVSDLSEQNNMLLKTVEELEKEAINQIDAFSSLAVAARDTIQQDVKSDLNQLLELMRRLREEKRLCACGLSFKTIRYEDIFGEQPIITPNAIECCEDYCYYQYGGDAVCTKSDLPKFSRYQRRYRTQRGGAEDSKSFQVESNKVSELQEALKQNEIHLATCMLEVERLTSCMSEKDLEFCKLKKTQERMGELERTISVLENDLKDRSSLVESLQTDNEKVKGAALNIDERLQDVNQQLEVIKEEIKEKDSLLDKYRSQSFNAEELENLDSTHLNKILTMKENLIQQLIEKNKESRTSVNDLRICELESNIKYLECKLAKRESFLNKTSKERDSLKSEIELVRMNSDSQKNSIEELLSARVQDELEQTKDALDSEQQRVKQLEKQVAHLQTALTMRKSSSGDIQRISLLSHEIESLRDQLTQKIDEISKCKEKEDNLKFQLSQANNSIKDIEREWKDKALKYEKELEKRKSPSYYNQTNLHKDITTTNKLNYIDVKTNSIGNIEMLQFKLKDMQEALTGEIADKHDEIRRLKDDVKELEEKLLHSDKQTQFKDDIIKELRKEVKIGRAKESLAEMLGLKGTPRAVMKTRIDHLTCQLEEMRTHVVSLEGRLGECNLPAVISLKSRLSSAEGSLLAMCNKMDYVRRYLENLKGNEELSIKCGLEALLSELREDVEWNRQTRRNLSLDEGTSVIVISHRSHSLPDNSFHRLVSKTKSDSAVITASRQASLHSKHSLESFEECRKYVEVINKLESDFEETCGNVNSLWNEFQRYTKGNGDCLLNEMNNILMSFDISKTTITEIVKQMENISYYKENDILYYHIHCLKGNLQEISDSLSKAHLLSSSSELSFNLEAGDAGVKQKLSTAINDSLSIVQVIENLKTSTHAQYKENSLLEENSLPDIISIIKSVLEEKEKFFEQMGTVQRQQLEFSQTLMRKMMEFEKGFCNYNSSAQSLKKETRKLFAIILAKEKQLQKQFDEMDDLKMALSSNKYIEEVNEQIDSLRKVVSDKDFQLDEKQDLINDLRSLNHSVHKSVLSQSSPSLSLMSESHENVIDKSHQLEEGVLSLKEKLSTMSEEILRSKAKMHKFEYETRSLVEALTKIHQELPNPKESTSEDLEQLSRLSTSISEAENKGEELLQALKSFIFEEQPDFQELTDSVNDHIESLLDITENIKRSSENERLSMKSIKDENNTMKQQLSKLLNRLTLPSNRETEAYDRLPFGSQHRENKQAQGKNDFTKTLKKGLSRSDPYLEKMQVHTSLEQKKAKDTAQGSAADGHESKAQRRANSIEQGSLVGLRESDAQRRAKGFAPGSFVEQQEWDAQRRANSIEQVSLVGLRESDAQRRAKDFAPGSFVEQQEWDVQRKANSIEQVSLVGLRESDAQRRAKDFAPGSFDEQQEWDEKIKMEAIAPGSVVEQREWDEKIKMEAIAPGSFVRQQEWDAQRRSEGIALGSPIGRQWHAQRSTKDIAPGSRVGQQEWDAQRRAEGVAPGSPIGRQWHEQRRVEGIAPDSHVEQRERDSQRKAEGITSGSPGGKHQWDEQRTGGFTPGSLVEQREWDGQRRVEGIAPGSFVGQQEWDEQRMGGFAPGSLVEQREWDGQRMEGITPGSFVVQQEWDAQRRAEGIVSVSPVGKSLWDVCGIELFSSEEHEIEEVSGFDEKDYIFQRLQEDLCRSHCYLQRMQEKYSSLKLENAEMEARTQKVMEELQAKKLENAEMKARAQKVMEELQAKVCKLQAASQNKEPETKVLYQLRCVIDQQSQEFEEAKQYIVELEENHLENQLEIKTLKNELNTLECRYNELQVKFEEAKEFIIKIQEKLSEKENESEENRIQILTQQNEIEKLDKELRIKSEQLEELQITREISNGSINSQLQELMELKEKEVCWENLFLHLKKEISNRSDQAEHWLSVSNKQKENLTNLITENYLLKAENDKCENEKTHLLHDLKTKGNELCELTEALVNTKQTMMKLNQEKDVLEHINSDLQKLLQEQQRFVFECNESGTENNLQAQEDYIALLMLRITQMNSFLADRDETINILQSQLQMSTMLLLDNIDAEDNNNDFCSALNDVMDKNSIARAAAYKMKLLQSLELNRRLVSIIDLLQQTNYSLLQKKSYTNQVEE